MPSMFSRRRGSSANPPVDRNTTTSAAAAASQAFLRRPPSNSSLSSSAAAAALRSQTSTPQPVGSIQTKRMVRRGSASSAGSGSQFGGSTTAAATSNPASPRLHLQRNGSSASMTERTFRSPSPARSAAGAPSPAASMAGVPPVPAIPATIPSAHRRSTSVEAQQRVTSPTPQRGRRGASADRASMPPPAPGLSIRKPKRLSDVAEMEEADRQNPSSVNFSRPMSPQAPSPVSPTGAAKKYTHTAGAWHTVPAGNAAGVANAGGVRSPSTGSAPQSKVDRILQSGRAAAASAAPPSRIQTASANEANESVMVYDPNSRSFITVRQGPAPAVPEPSSPTFTTDKPDPGVWDPNTRSFAPRPGSGSAVMNLDNASDSSLLRQRRQQFEPMSVDTFIEPPPKNPARYSPNGGSPSSPRVSSIQRQPSVVKEDPEAEERAESSTNPSSMKFKRATYQAGDASRAYNTAAAESSRQRSASLDVPVNDGSGRGRNVSISPQRSTRFSESPVVGALKHDPPPRDFSPAKSALKQPSPVPSLNIGSPATTTTTAAAASSAINPRSPPSETSDIQSDIASQDGLTDSAKKRKSVRVSFEEQPQSIQVESPPSSVYSQIEDGDDDAVMKPRPALPSFGSVRKNRFQAEPAQKVTEMPPERHEVSSDHVVGGILRNTKDQHGPQQQQQQQPRNDPVPPEVTSKESAGYVSDSGSEPEVSVPPTTTTAPAAVAHEAEAPPPQVKDFVSPPEAESTETGLLPAINLLPPTPGTDEDNHKVLLADPERKDDDFMKRSSMDGIVLPGSWRNEAEAKNVSSGASASSNLEPDKNDSDDDDAEFSDAAEDLSELDDGGFASLNAIVESPVVTPVKPAVVKEAPTVAPSVSQASAALNSTTRPGPDVPEISPQQTSANDEDWSKATAYWAKLTKQQRQQIERDHFSDDESPPAASAVTVKDTKKPKSVLKSTNTNAAKTASSDAQAAAAAPLLPPSQQPAMRKSMRQSTGPSAAPSGGSQLRQSMRNTGAMPSTMRSGRPAAAAAAAQSQAPTQQPSQKMRPMSLPGPQASSTSISRFTSQPPESPDDVPLAQDSAYPLLGASRPESQRPISPPPQKPAQPTPQVSARLAKELAAADDSDSESSFRKRRRAGSGSTVDSQGKYSMKRSMRSGSVDAVPPLPTQTRPISPTPPGRAKKAFSLRSLSPTDSTFSRTKSEKLRSSLRDGPSDGGKRTTLRGPPPPPSSKSSTSRNAKRSTVSGAPASSRLGSRFGADSDDEDEGGGGSFGRGFRSRFSNSDDEDEAASPGIIPADLTPVRGIPRRQGQQDGESTDLDDSDEEDRRKASRNREKQQQPAVPNSADIDKAMEIARRNLGLDGREGQKLSKGTLRDDGNQALRPKSQTVEPQPPTPERRRSLFGSILRRNRTSSASVPQVAPSSPAVTTPPRAVAPSSPGPVGSPASPSSPNARKLVRKNSDRPHTSRGDSYLSTATAPPFTNVGVAASSGLGNDSEHWPFPPPPIPVDAEQQGGGDRPNTSDGVSTNAEEAARSMRPDVKRRSVSGQTAPAQGNRVRIQAGEEGSEPGERNAGTIYSRRTGKKKKFGMLRRALKLDD